MGKKSTYNKLLDDNVVELTKHKMDFLKTYGGIKFLEKHFVEFQRTKKGKEWFNNDGYNWFVSKFGQKWFSTKDGNKWLLSDNGEEWFFSVNGIKWFLSESGQKWFLSDNGINMIEMIYYNNPKWNNKWIEWLENSENGRKWLNSESGNGWIYSLNGKECVINEIKNKNFFINQQWMISEQGMKWIEKFKDNDWYNVWINTDCGKMYLDKKKV